MLRKALSFVPGRKPEPQYILVPNTQEEFDKLTEEKQLELQKVSMRRLLLLIEQYLKSEHPDAIYDEDLDTAEKDFDPKINIILIGSPRAGVRVETRNKKLIDTICREFDCTAIPYSS